MTEDQKPLWAHFWTCYGSPYLSAQGESRDLQHLSPMLARCGNIALRDIAHVGIGPINTGKPHRCPSLSNKKSLGKSGPSIQVLAARPSHRRWSQESCQGSTISLKRSSREEVKVFPRQFLTGQGVS